MFLCCVYVSCVDFVCMNCMVNSGDYRDLLILKLIELGWYRNCEKGSRM